MKATVIMAKKFLIVVIIAVALGALGFVFKDQLLSLVSKNPPGNNINQNKPQAIKIETKRVDIANLALPQGLPANFPLPVGAKITESYNLTNTENNKPTRAYVTLISSQSPDEIKNFFTGKLKAPEYKLQTNASKTDTKSKKTLAFSDKYGLLVISITQETSSTVIKVNQDIFVSLNS